MTTALIVSNLLLWCVVVALTVILFALTRQIGVLHERVAPAGALTPTSGPKVGELTEPVETTDLAGLPLLVGGAADKATLLLFISPTCPVCRNLVPTAKSMARHEGLQLVFASDGDTVARHQAYARDLELTDYPYVLSQPLGIGFGVSKLPFAVLITEDGTLAGKGLVNTREHLESLVESMMTGVPTLQDFVKHQDQEANQTVQEHAP